MEDFKQQCTRIRQTWIDGDHSTAYALYENLLQKYPENPYLCSEYALALYASTDNMEQATQLLERALTFSADALVTLLGLGELYAMNYGPQKDALPLFQRAMKRVPQNKIAIVIASVQTGLLLSEPEERITFFKQAVTIDPTREAAHQNLAVEFCLAGKFQAAWQELKQVEQIRQAAKMPILHIQKELERILSKNSCKITYAVETVLSSWISGETDTW